MYLVRTSAATNTTEQFMGIAKFVQSFRVELFQIHPLLHNSVTLEFLTVHTYTTCMHVLLC
jgi:hypothetical protein